MYVKCCHCVYSPSHCKMLCPDWLYSPLEFSIKICSVLFKKKKSPKIGVFSSMKIAEMEQFKFYNN